MQIYINISFNLVIDEFHEFYNIIESVYSDIQNLLRIDAGEICEEE